MTSKAEIIDKLHDADALEVVELTTFEGDDPAIERCYIEAVKLDSFTFAFRHNTPSFDSEWQIGSKEDVADFWEEEYKASLAAAEEAEA